MLPGRPPISDYDDTLDEIDQSPPIRGRTNPGAERVVDAFIDAPPDDPRAPRNVDLHDRITALELALPSAETNARWIRHGVKALSGLLGLGAAVLVYALSLSRSAGDATGEKRARDIERARYIGIIDELVRDVARHDGTIHSLLEAIRSRYPIGAQPLLGPPPQPPQQDDEP